MLRWASNIFCAFSLLLFLMLAIYGALYGKSARGVWLKRTDVVGFGGKDLSTPHIYYFSLNGTRFVFGHWRNPEFVENLKGMHKEILEELQQMRRGMTETLERTPDSHRARMAERLSDLDQRISRLRNEANANSYSDSDGFNVGYHDGVYSTQGSSIRLFGGIQYDSLPGWRPPATAFRCFLPIWCILPVLALAPAWRGISIWRRIRRRRANTCPTCGYDLRATPNLCPECGNAAK